jgi:hypothetical protein
MSIAEAEIVEMPFTPTTLSDFKAAAKASPGATVRDTTLSRRSRSSATTAGTAEVRYGAM